MHGCTYECTLPWNASKKINQIFHFWSWKLSFSFCILNNKEILSSIKSQIIHHFRYRYCNIYLKIQYFNPTNKTIFSFCNVMESFSCKTSYYFIFLYFRFCNVVHFLLCIRVFVQYFNLSLKLNKVHTHPWYVM